MEKYKPCNGCNQVKPYSAYYLDRRPGRTVQSRCIECQKAYLKANKEQISRRRKAYYQANKDQWQKVHRFKYDANPELFREKSAKWRKENPERFRNQLINWRLANKEKHNEAGSRRRSRKKQNKTYLIRKKELKRIYFSSCFYCGSDSQITLEHLIPIARGGNHSIGNLVPACKSCNSSKKDLLLMEWKKKKGYPATYN